MEIVSGLTASIIVSIYVWIADSAVGISKIIAVLILLIELISPIIN